VEAPVAALVEPLVFWAILVDLAVEVAQPALQQLIRQVEPAYQVKDLQVVIVQQVVHSQRGVQVEVQAQSDKTVDQPMAAMAVLVLQIRCLVVI
jgi:hypothetical protein